MHKKETGVSLSANNLDIIRYLPYLLQDLWALGFPPEIQKYLIKSLEKEKLKIIDLGCGKGCSLIEILKFQKGTGLGIDIIPEFIEEAEKISLESGTEEIINFRCEDLLVTIKNENNFDVVLYGVDSDILGTPYECIKQLKKVLIPKGFIILDTVYPKSNQNNKYPGRNKYSEAISHNGCKLIKEILIEPDVLIKINLYNTKKIKIRAQELMKKYPSKRKIFKDYINDQIKECKELENELDCVTLLIQSR